MNCTIVRGVTIGEYDGGVADSNGPEYALMVVVPVKQIGWISTDGERLDLPIKGDVCCTSTHSQMLAHCVTAM